MQQTMDDLILTWIKDKMAFFIGGFFRSRFHGRGSAYTPVATYFEWINAPATIPLNAFGATGTAVARVTDQYHVPMASQPSISYTSGTTANITVISATGVMTAVANGGSLITAATSGYTSVTGTANVAQVLNNIVISPATPTVANGTAQVFTKQYRDRLNVNMTSNAGTWASSDPTNFPINSSTGSCTPNVSTGSAVVKYTDTATGIFGTTSITAQTYTQVATYLVWLDSAPGLSYIGQTANSRAQVQDQFHSPMSSQIGLTYSSATPANATIGSTTGLVTAVANGTSVLSALFSGITTITQTATVLQVLNSIVVSGTAPTVGNTATFTASGKDSGGTVLVSQPTYTWASTDPTKATVNSSTGVVTGVATGATTISATASSISGTKLISISAAPPVATTLVWLDSAPTLTAIGNTATLRAQINDQYGVALASQAGIAETSGSTSKITISGTTLTAVANGTSVITATYSGVSSINITATVAQALSSITISPSNPTIQNGTAQIFTAAGFDSTSHAMSAGTGTWSSSNNTNFPINTSTGSCTPNVDSGTSTVKFTNTASGIFGTTIISASTATASLSVSPSSTSGAPGDTIQYTVYLEPAHTDISSRIYGYPADTSVATMDAPTLTSISPSSINRYDSTISTVFTGTNIKGTETIGGLPSGVTVASYTYTGTTVTVNISASSSATLGPASLYLISNRGNSGAQALTVVNAVPTLTSISPSSIAQSSSGSFTFTGTHIRSGQTIGGLPSGVSASSLAYTSTTIICTLTATGGATLGGASIDIVDGTYGTSNTQTLTVSNSAPTLTSITPNTITQGTGPITYTFVGTNFTSGQTIGGLPTGVTAGTVTIVSGTTITVPLTASGSATTGAASLYIVDGTHGNSGTQTLTVVTSGVPAGTAVSAVYMTGTSATTAPGGILSATLPLAHNSYSGSPFSNTLSSSVPGSGGTSPYTNCNATSPQSGLFGIFTSAVALSAQTLPTGTYTLSIGLWAENGESYHFAPVVYVWRNGVGKIGTLHDSATGIGSITDSGGTAATGGKVMTFSGTGFAVLSGDFLVIEPWIVGGNNDFVHLAFNGHLAITEGGDTSSGDVKSGIAFPSNIYFGG